MHLGLGAEGFPDALVGFELPGGAKLSHLTKGGLYIRERIKERWKLLLNEGCDEIGFGPSGE